MEAFTDTLSMLCMGFMYGSISRHFTDVVHGLYVWKHVLQTLYRCCAWALCMEACITDTVPMLCMGFKASIIKHISLSLFRIPFLRHKNLTIINKRDS